MSQTRHDTPETEPRQQADSPLASPESEAPESEAFEVAASELAASEARFRAIFEAAPVAISISREGILLYVNRASIELLGCRNAGEMIGRPVSEFVAPTDRESMLERIAARAAGQNVPLAYEALALRGDGKSLPLRVEVTPFTLPDGPATLGFAFDLSAERAAEAQRAALMAKERRAAFYAARLQETTAELAASLSGSEVAQLIVSRGVAALDASAGALSMPHKTERGDELEIVAATGYPPAVMGSYARLSISLDSPLPAVRALNGGQAIWIESVSQAKRDFPAFGEILQTLGYEATCVLPLKFENRVIGILNLSFAAPRQFDTEVRAFLGTLAGQCAQALERVRLFNEAQVAARLQRESLALLNTLLDTAPVGFAFFDLRGRYVLVNEALARINAMPVVSHLGRAPREILPVTGTRIADAVALVLQTQKPSGEIEFEGEPPTMAEATAEAAATEHRVSHSLNAFYPVRTADGEILGVGSVVIDISARVSAERDRVQLLGELEIERARFEAILQQMPSAVIIAEAPSGRLVLGNPQVGEVLGQPYIAAENVEQYVRYHGFHFDGRELGTHEWPLARAIEHGEIVRGEEIVVRRSDDSTGVIRINAAPIRDRDGQIAAGIVIFEDVTPRARADAAQRFLAEAGSALISTLDERASYQQLADLCVPGVTDWCLVAVPGDDGLLSQIAIGCVNAEKTGIVAQFQADLAADPQLPWNISGALRGQSAVLYPQRSIESLREISTSPTYRRFIEQIGAKSAIVTPLAARGRVLGTMIWLSAESGRIYDDDDLELADELARRAGLAAANARLYFEAQTARHEAENANRAKDEFLAVVSHELRTPLTPILGWLELLRAPNAGEEIRAQAYTVIERNARAQAQLINDILDVSRTTTGKLRFEWKSVALREIVAGVALSLQPDASVKNIDLRLEIGDVGLLTADANRLQQVVGNLLQNALKFTPAGGAVQVSLRALEGRAILEISDNGQGIDPGFLPHVFDRFRQADSSATRRTGGLGLGLAIVAHIVEGHGGQVSARSDGVGSGSVFRVELPLHNEEFHGVTKPNAGEESRRKDVRAGGFRAQESGLAPWKHCPLDGLDILVVDDDPDTRQMLQKLLETAGARVESVASASAALSRLAVPSSESQFSQSQERDTSKSKFSADILISDIGMEGSSGYDLRRELARRGQTLPSIAVSAYTAPEDAQKSLAAGFDAHIGKPIDAEKLLLLIIQLTGATKNEA